MTDAELAGAVEIDERPFIASLHNAEGAWMRFNSGLEVSSGFNAVSKSAIAMGTIIGNVATSAITQLSSLASSALGTGVSFLKMKEQATTAFTNLFQSAEKAKGFIAELAAFANKTPFELPELIKAAQKFTAMGFSAKEVIPILTSVGNAVAAMGGSSAQIDRVTTALVQMKAKGKVSAQEMMQLAEAGIPAWQILAEKIGKSIPEAMKLGEKGALSATMAIEALVQGMDARFGGMMEKQSHTFAGLMSTISDTSQQVLGSVLEPLFASATTTLQAFVNVLPEMQKGIEGMTEQTKLAAVAFAGLALATGAAATAIAVAIGGPAALAVAGLGIQVAAVTAAIISNFGQIGSAIAAWTGDTQINFSTVLKWIGMGADGFAIFARSILQGVDIIGTALVVLGKGFMGVMGILQGFGTSVKGILSFDPSQIITGVAQMQGAFTKFDVGVSTQIRALTQRIKTNLQDTADNMNGKYATAFVSAGTKIGGAFTKAANSVQEFVNKAEGLVKNANKATEGVMGAGGAKKGKDDTEKILKEQLDFVNSWTKETGHALALNMEVWKRLGPEIKKTLLQASAAFHKSVDDAQTWAAKIQAAFINAANGDLGKTLIVKLKGTKIQIESPVIEMKSDVDALLGRSGLSTAGLKIPARIEFSDDKKYQEALDRSLLDILKIQTDSQDARKAADAKYQEAIRKQGEENNKKYQDMMRGHYNDLRGAVGEGLADILAEIGKFAGVSLGRMTEVTTGIVDVIGGMPGKIGDKLRGVTNKVLDFINGIDRMMKGLHKIFDSIPNGLGGVLDKIIGTTKAKIPDIGKAIDDAFGKVQNSAKKGMAGFIDTIKGGLGFATGLFGSFATGLGVANSTGSKTQGAIMGGLTGALSGAATGAAWGAAGGPIGAGVGAAIGAGVGIIGGLFGGGKSKEQKAAEEAAKQKAGLDMQKLAADIMSSQMEGLKKGLELLEGLKTFSEVPKKAIKRFFNEIELIITLFAEMAKKFKADSIEASKAVSEMMGDSFGALLTGADLINAIKGVASISDQNIADFISTTVKVAEKWGEAASAIEMQTAKFAGKISDKLKTSFEFLSTAIEVINAIPEKVKVNPFSVDALFLAIQNIVQKMKALSEAERGLELNKANSSAGMFSTILTPLKDIIETLTAFSTYKAFADSTLDTITADLYKVINWMDSLSELAAKGIGRAETLQDVLKRFGDALSGVQSGLSSVAGAFSTSPTSGITASITSGSGAQFVQRQSGASPAPTVVNNYYGDVNNNISFKELEEIMRLPNAIEVLQNRLNAMQSKTGQQAQAFTGQ